MSTCTACGTDVTGKKFCPECGTPVKPINIPDAGSSSTATCPHCNGEVRPGAAFCLHCGSALHTPAVSVTQPPTTLTCPTCSAQVPTASTFCTQCGHDMRAAAATQPTAASASIFCGNCGKQNAAGVRFCNSCGNPVTSGTPMIPSSGYTQPGQYPQSAPYQQPTPYPQSAPYQQDPYQQSAPYQQPTPYPQSNPYQQAQYQQSAPYQQQAQYPQSNPYQQTPYPQPQYNQGGYQPQPMLGQQPMALRCPTCMAVAPLGSVSCSSCQTNLAGVVPTPMTTQGQQGGIGGFFQGNGGKYAMGALGGAAAVLGGEMLLHGVENSIENGIGGDMGIGGYEHHRRREEGLLGGLGELADDIGL